MALSRLLSLRLLRGRGRSPGGPGGLAGVPFRGLAGGPSGDGPSGDGPSGGEGRDGAAPKAPGAAGASLADKVLGRGRGGGRGGSSQGRGQGVQRRPGGATAKNRRSGGGGGGGSPMTRQAREAPAGFGRDDRKRRTASAGQFQFFVDQR